MSPEKPGRFKVNLCGITCAAFSDRLGFFVCCACTMLVRFNIAAINKFPFTIRIDNQRLENP